MTRKKPLPTHLYALLALGAAWLVAGCDTAPPATQARSVAVKNAECQPASYPAEARRLNAAGQTEVEFEVNPEGKVTRVAIVKTSGSTQGHQALDALALATISQCKFPPAPGFLSGTGRMAYVWQLEK